MYITFTYGNPYSYFLSGDGNTAKSNKTHLSVDVAHVNISLI
jgi:hypothetical protein